MNHLLSMTFSKRGFLDVETGEGGMEMQDSVVDMQTHMAGFHQDVENIMKDIEKVKELLKKLQEENEESKTLHSPKALRALKDRMEDDVSSVTKTAKSIKGKLEQLDKTNVESRKVNGCGANSPTDRARMNITNGLRKNLTDYTEAFSTLRAKMLAEYKETIERRYYTITGQKPDEETLDRMIETGESETFLQRAVQEQGRGKVLDTIKEIQERHDGVKEIEKNLLELHSIFLDMSILVEAQGAELDDIEKQMKQADSFVHRAVKHTEVARRHQKNTRKWVLLAIILLIIIILIIVIPIVISANKKK